MTKTTYRVLTILAIFVGVMLLLVQLMVGTAVAAQPETALTTSSMPANRPPITSTVPIIPTHPNSSAVEIAAPLAGDCVQEPTTTHKVYLPIAFSGNGSGSDARIKLVQEQEQARIKGLTVFGSINDGTPNATPPTAVALDISEFSFSPSTTCVRWWYPSNTEISSTYQYLTETIAVELLPNIEPGAQEIKVQFVSKINIPLSLQTFYFFYIPNGDFAEEYSDDLSIVWDFTGDFVKMTGETEARLFLYHKDGHTDMKDDCNEAEVGFVATSIDLQLPSNSEYHLRVEGVVYTQDQNPSNSSTFDAFEVVIDGIVADRVSNMDQPIRCDPVINRQVAINSNIPLSGYSGHTTISLENHRRFDNQYDTYTEIDMVWIDY